LRNMASEFECGSLGDPISAVEWRRESNVSCNTT
jgi:hypothetical protein